MSRTLVGAAEPDPIPGAWSWGWSAGVPYRVDVPALPYLREVRDDTVPLTGWMGSSTNYSRSHEMVPATYSTSTSVSGDWSITYRAGAR